MRNTPHGIRTVIFSAVICLAMMSMPVFAQVPYERVLFPIVTGIPVQGVNGSVWVSELRVLNRSAADVTLYGGFMCFMCDPKYGPIRFSPGATYFHVPLMAQLGTPPGSFLFIDRTAINDVAFSLRIRDISRTDRSFGTELPVVRDADFSASRVDLLGVPTDVRFRRTLRVYASTESGGAIAVRVFSERGATGSGDVGPEAGVPDSLVSEQTFTLSEPPAKYVFRSNYPAFISIGEIPALASVPTETTHIEIVPLTSGLRIWAFVSVTNNETQEVTIVSPQ